jgi:hypothetical protein
MELRFAIILGAAYAVNTWTIGLFCFENRLFSFSRCLGGLCVEDGDFERRGRKGYAEDAKEDKIKTKNSDFKLIANSPKHVVYRY